MFNVYWITAISGGALACWPISVFVRRWWIKPYRNPKRVLKKIQRSLRLSRTEVRHLDALLGTQRDPIASSQFLLDPTRWPIASQDDLTKKLHTKVFTERCPGNVSRP